MATMNISIPEPMRKWVQDRIHTGRYANNSDYIRDLIRKDQERQLAHQEMQTAIAAGIQSGESTQLDMTEIKARARAELGKSGR
ncbi:MAG: type II toxin-antitoxin system ParD family antitoxin [Hahellaceae bacterium]|nr:type II toxin-antitoxin system ParD family antitoxin [Hahellaceae bacterium]